ncbi:MAG TPA: MASE1 domain-containing protein [Verrucomicrobiae bacterium]|nr:MASE1 domain-containing protein [Verrucomicrobiae bacterium]
MYNKTKERAVALAKMVHQLDRKYVTKVLLTALFYIAAAKLGLALANNVRQVTSVWPPTGIAFVILLVFGYRLWPGIIIGAFIANLFTSEPWYVAAGISIGNTLEALVGAFLIQKIAKIKPQNLINTAKNILVFVLFAACISTSVGATIGVFSLAAGGIIHWSQYGTVWATYWSGDMTGDLIFAPVLLALIYTVRRSEIRRRLPEALIMTAVTVSVGIFVFWYDGNNRLPITYLVYPVLIWAAFRYRQAGVAMAVLVFSVAAVWGTVNGRGPFINYHSESLNLILLQVFLFVASVTSLLVAAMVSERLDVIKALDKSEELSKAKDEFIDLASHELRTPATHVKQFISLVQEGFIKGQLNKEQKWALNQAFAGNERLLKIINDLLEVAKLDAGKVVVNDAPTDLTKLTQDVIQKQKPIMKKRKQTVSSKLPKKTVMLLGDPALLRIVITNLLDNASKYSPEGKHVVVKLTETKDSVKLSVQDEGVGIDPRHMSKLFEKFARFDNALSVKVSGSGVGLYWAKKIIDYHGGTISVKSKLDQGTTVTVAFPR